MNLHEVLAASLALCAFANPAAHAANEHSISEAAPTEAPLLGGFIRETRVLYPLRVGDWQAQGEHLFDQQEFGVSVRYQHAREKERWLDLFFYAAGVLPESRLDADAAEAMEGIRDSSGSDRDAEAAPLLAVSLPLASASGDSEDTVSARSASLRLLREGKAYSSAMLLLVKDLYYVKGRYSAPATALSPREAQRQLERFMAETMRRVRLLSTGECWTSAMEHARDAPPSGCFPAEDMTPAVPADLREIRLEYGVPPGDGDKRTVPLEAETSAVS